MQRRAHTGAMPIPISRAPAAGLKPHEKDPAMIKVMWFLKRAPHLTLEEFGDWWLNVHAADIAADQAPTSRNTSWTCASPTTARSRESPQASPPGTASPSSISTRIEDYNAVYSRTDRPTRADTLAHTSAFERLVVTEHLMDMPALIARHRAKAGTEPCSS
jgi:hypothetical protein